MRTSKCAVLCESRIRIAYCVWMQRNISSTSARISGPKLDTYCCWMVRLATRWRKRKTCYWMKQQWFCATFYATTKFHINRVRREATKCEGEWWWWCKSEWFECSPPTEYCFYAPSLCSRRGILCVSRSFVRAVCFPGLLPPPHPSIGGRSLGQQQQQPERR